MKKLLFFLLLLAGMSQAQTTVAPFVNSKVQFLNGSSACNGCKLNTYSAGTSTPLATYSESTGTTPNANPIVLDSNGLATIYLTSASYKFVLTTSAGVTIWSQDNVSWANLANTVTSLISNGTLQVIPSTAATSGANQSGPNLQDCGNAWNGSSSIADCWSFSDVLGTGSNPTSTLTLTHSGSSGSAIFSIPGSLSVGGTLFMRSLGICDASSPAYSAGSDAGAKINLAEADSNCITVDATNFTSPTAAATITATKPLILGAYTLSVSGSPGISIPNTFSYVKGKGRNLTIVSTTSGTADIIAVPSATEWFGIYDLAVQSSVARTAGAGMRISGGHGTIERNAIYPVFDGITFDTASNADNNVVRDLEVTNGTGTPSAGSGGTWHCGVKVGGVPTGTVSGNLFDNLTVSMNTAFTDAGICIQDGADTTTITNSQAVANIGGSDSVSVHIEVVNGGNPPSITKFIGDTFEGGLTKNAVVIDANANAGIEFTNVNTNSSLRGYLINTGNGVHITGGQIYSNQQEGIRAVAFSDLQVMGVRFGNNSQATTNTYDDIFVAANQTQFKFIGNSFADYSSTGKVSKWNMEIAAGTSNFYDISDNMIPGSAGTGAISDGGTGTSKRICNPNSGSGCNFGASPLVMLGSSSGSVQVQAAAAAGSPTITWPTVTGTLGELTGSQTFFEACSGTASAGTTLAMQWSGGACTSSATALQVPTASAGTLLNMRVKCGTAGTNASSGVFTLNKNGSTATALTCTVGTGTTCSDTTHTVAAAAGDTWQVFFTTQAAETMANCAVSWEKQ